MKAEFSTYSSNSNFTRDQPADSISTAMPANATPTLKTGKLNLDLPRPNLTEREKEVLRLVCDGLTNSEIAACLGVSRETVKSELKRIFRKIGVANRTQAAVLLVKRGWL